VRYIPPAGSRCPKRDLRCEWAGLAQAVQEAVLNSPRFARTYARAAALVLACLLTLPLVAQQAYTGQWLLDQRSGDSVQFTIRYSNDGEHRNWFNSSSWSTDAALSSLQGLNVANLNSSTGANLHFRVVRDAGAFDCVGWGRNGDASGHWTFEPSASYAQELRKRGLTTPAPSEQFDMAMADISIALVDELKNDGYHLDLSDLIRAGKHGVSVEYVRGMKAAGYKFDDIETLTKMRDHGVTPKYVQEMASFGYKNLAADDLRRLRDHGITGEYLRSMEQAGFKGLSAEQAVRLRDHGVTADFVAAMAKSGFQGLSAEELVRMRDHGVNSDYISGMIQAGYKDLSASDLTRLRDHGVSPSYVRELAQVGLTNLGTQELQRLRDHGVDAGYVRDLKAVGVTTTDAYELTRMRDVGVNASFVKEARERGFSTTDPGELVRLRTRGWDRRTAY